MGGPWHCPETFCGQMGTDHSTRMILIGTNRGCSKGDLGDTGHCPDKENERLKDSLVSNTLLPHEENQNVEALLPASIVTKPTAERTARCPNLTLDSGPPKVSVGLSRPKVRSQSSTSLSFLCLGYWVSLWEGTIEMTKTIARGQPWAQATASCCRGSLLCKKMHVCDPPT